MKTATRNKVRDYQIQIEQSETVLTLKQIQSAGRSPEMKLFFDGKEHEVLKEGTITTITSAHWEGQALHVKIGFRADGVPSDMSRAVMQKLELSQNGKRLTRTSRTNGPGMKISTVEIFEKQAK